MVLPSGSKSDLPSLINSRNENNSDTYESVFTPSNSYKSNEDSVDKYKSVYSQRSSSKRNEKRSEKYDSFFSPSYSSKRNEIAEKNKKVLSRDNFSKRKPSISEIIGKNQLPPILPLSLMDGSERTDLTSIFDFSTIMSNENLVSDVVSVIRREGLYNSIGKKSEKANYTSSLGDNETHELSYNEEKGADIVKLCCNISLSIIQAVLKSGGNVQDASAAFSAVLKSSRESYEKGCNPSHTLHNALACALTAMLIAGTSQKIATSAITSIVHLELDIFETKCVEKESMSNKSVHFKSEEKKSKKEMSLNQFIQKTRSNEPSTRQQSNSYGERSDNDDRDIKSILKSSVVSKYSNSFIQKTRNNRPNKTKPLNSYGERSNNNDIDIKSILKSSVVSKNSNSFIQKTRNNRPNKMKPLNSYEKRSNNYDRDIKSNVVSKKSNSFIQKTRNNWERSNNDDRNVKSNVASKKFNSFIYKTRKIPNQLKHSEETDENYESSYQSDDFTKDTNSVDIESNVVSKNSFIQKTRNNRPNKLKPLNSYWERSNNDDMDVKSNAPSKNFNSFIYKTRKNPNKLKLSGETDENYQSSYQSDDFTQDMSSVDIKSNVMSKNSFIQKTRNNRPNKLKLLNSYGERSNNDDRDVKSNDVSMYSEETDISYESSYQPDDFTEDMSSVDLVSKIKDHIIYTEENDTISHSTFDTIVFQLASQVLEANL